LTLDEVTTILERQADSPSDAFANLSEKILEKLMSK